MPDIRISCAEDMVRAVHETGMIPFFKNIIPGYSIQEMTAPGFWFGDEQDTLGPWDWKIACIQSGDIAYGKFLCGGKASFATIPFYRELMNVRRASCVPDGNGRRILEKLEEQGSISIKEVRGLLNVKKGPADAAVSKLQHQCRVVTGDISRVYSGPNLSYKGWQVSSFCTPEALFGEDSPTLQFPGFPADLAGESLRTDHTPEESLEMLTEHIAKLFPLYADKQKVLKVLK